MLALIILSLALICVALFGALKVIATLANDLLPRPRYSRWFFSALGVRTCVHDYAFFLNAVLVPILLYLLWRTIQLLRSTLHSPLLLLLVRELLRGTHRFGTARFPHRVQLTHLHQIRTAKYWILICRSFIRLRNSALHAILVDYMAFRRSHYLRRCPILRIEVLYLKQTVLVLT